MAFCPGGRHSELRLVIGVEGGFIVLSAVEHAHDNNALCDIVYREGDNRAFLVMSDAQSRSDIVAACCRGEEKCSVPHSSSRWRSYIARRCAVIHLR